MMHRTSSRPRLLAACVAFAALTSGCHAPYLHAAATYADASEASTAAVASVRSTAGELCLKKARLHYLDSSLKGDGTFTPWHKFLTSPRPGGQASWQAYCGKVEDSAEMFGVGVAALSAYASALAALAETGGYDGSDIKTLGEKASSIAASLDAEAASKAIKPVGNILGTLAGLLLRTVSERKMKQYVIEAEPTIQALLAALQNYVAALSAALLTQETAEARQTAIKNAEAAAFAVKPFDGARVVQFAAFAASVDDDAARAQVALDGHVAVLKKLAAAHTKLAEASRADASDDDVKAVLGTIADLLEQVQGLRAALKKEEE